MVDGTVDTAAGSWDFGIRNVNGRLGYWQTENCEGPGEWGVATRGGQGRRLGFAGACRIVGGSEGWRQRWRRTAVRYPWIWDYGEGSGAEVMP